MELTEILNYIFGGTSLVGLATTVIFWNKSKRKEEAETQKSEAEAKQSNIEAQRQEIDLMKYMRETMAEWMAQTEDGNKKNFANQEKMMEQLSRMDERLEKIELRVGDMETYLNGEYHSWLANKHTNRYGKN